MEIRIEGRPVQIDDSFRDAPRDVQEKTIDELATKMGLRPGEAEGPSAAQAVGRMAAKAGAGGLGVLPAAAAVADAPTGAGGTMAAIDVLREQILPQGEKPNYQKVLEYLGIGGDKVSTRSLSDLVTGTPSAAPERRMPGTPIGQSVEQLQESAAGMVGPKPTTPGGRILEAAGTAAIEAIGGSTLFKLVGAGAGMIGSYREVKAAFDALGAAPVAQAGYSAAAGGGGQAAQEAGLPPIVGTVAGLVGAGAVHTGGRAVTAAPKVAKTAFDDSLLRTPELQEQAAAARLRGAVSDPDAVTNKLLFGESPELVPGSKPSLYEATGDTGAGQAQRLAMTEDTGGYRGSIEERRAAQNTARVEEIKNLGGTGDPGDFLSTFKRQRDLLDTVESGKEAGARTKADVAAGKAGTTATPEEVGAGLREPMEASRQKVAETGNKLYQALDAEGVTVGTGQLKAAVAQHFKDIPENPLSSLERRIAKVVTGYSGRLDFETLQQLRSRVVAETRNFNTNDVTRRRFTLLKKAIDAAMDDGLQKAVTADGSLAVKVDDALTAAQREANRHWREYKQAYGPEPVLKKGATESGFKMGEAAIPKASFVPGDTGGARLRAMKAAGATDDALAEAAAFSMTKAAMRDGAVDPSAFRRWKENHKAAIAELPPDVQRRFQSAADAASTLEQVTATKQAALRRFDESAVGKILGVPAENLEIAIKGYLENPAKANELANAVSRDPAAKAGLQRLAADYILRQFKGASDDVSKAALTTFLYRNKPQMAAIFGNEGALRWQRLSDDIERARKQVVAGKDPGGPSTAADTFKSAAKTVAKQSVMQLLAGVTAGGVVGGLPGAAVVGAAQGLKMIHSAMRAAGLRSVDELYARALLDTELARKLLTRAPALKNDHFRKGLGTAILRSSALGAAYGGT